MSVTPSRPSASVPPALMAKPARHKKASTRAVTSGDPDAKLIKLCDDFAAKEKEWGELNAAFQGAEFTQAARPIQARMNQLSVHVRERRREIAEMPAHTMAGYLAKARAQAAHWGSLLPEPEGEHGIAASVILALAANTAAASKDPLVELHRQYLEFEAEMHRIGEVCDALRRQFVAAYGDVCGGSTGTQAASWAADPRRPDLTRLVKAANDASNRLAEITDIIMATAPSTLYGLAIKAQVALDLFPKYVDDIYQESAQTVLRDIRQMLTGASEFGV